jgi:hypothetical protein
MEKMNGETNEWNKRGNIEGNSGTTVENRKVGFFIFSLPVPVAKRTLRLQQALPRQDLLPESSARLVAGLKRSLTGLFYLPVLEDNAVCFPAKLPCPGNLQRTLSQ